MNCPNCDRELAGAERICPHCGHELTPAGPDQDRPASRRVVRGLVAVLLVLIVAALGSLVFLWFQLSENVPAVASGVEPAATDQAAVKGPAEAPTRAAPSPTISAPIKGTETEPVAEPSALASLADQVRPPGGYPLPASFGDLGPRLVAAGGIDYDRFARLYVQNGQPLSDRQVAILTKGSDSQVVIDADNAYFLLNFFWAVGLTNQNRILEEGAMMQYGAEGVGGFASTGGWTLGSKPSVELYSSAPLIALTAEQQALVEEVADAIYRPCCGNPTSFPDCNHGMAMLGLLELLASQGATLDEMFEAAKYVNAFWFPQQAMEVALYFQASEGLSFAELDARRAFGAEYFSGAGFGQVHRWLADNNLLPQAPGQGGSCGV